MRVILSLLLAQPQLVQTDGTTFQSSITLSAPVTQGNLLIAVPNWVDSAHGDQTLTDSMGNTWTQVATRAQGVGPLIDLNATVFVTEASSTGTLTVTPAVATYNFVLFEFSGAPRLPLVTTVGTGQSDIASDTDHPAVEVVDGGFALAWILVSGAVGATPASLTELSRYDGDFYGLTTTPGPLGVQMACSGAWVAQAVAFSIPAPDAGALAEDAGLEAPRRLSVGTGCTTSPEGGVGVVLVLALLGGVSRLRRFRFPP